jgi:hypothetical protein
MVHGEDTPKYLQEARVGARGGGGTIAMGSASRSHNWRRRRSAMASWILGNCGAEWLMCNIIIEPLMCYHLDHAHDVRSKFIRSLRVDDNVPYFIHNVVKHIKPLILHESI